MLKIHKCPFKRLKADHFYLEISFKWYWHSEVRPPSTSLYSFKFKNGSLRQLKTKEQEDDLTSQTLFVLKDMRIRFPGKSDAESELLIEDVSIQWVWTCVFWDWETGTVGKMLAGQAWTLELDPQNLHKSLAWWHAPVVSALGSGRQRQEDSCNLMAATPGYLVSPSSQWEVGS